MLHAGTSAAVGSAQNVARARVAPAQGAVSWTSPASIRAAYQLLSGIDNYTIGHLVASENAVDYWRSNPPRSLLFVPADRPERYAKAIASGATGAILDLEDAVSPDRKAFAREQVRAFLAAGGDRARTAVRINPADGPDGVADLAADRFPLVLNKIHEVPRARATVPRLVLLHDADDLLFAESALLHRWILLRRLPPKLRSSILRGPVYRVHVTRKLGWLMEKIVQNAHQMDHLKRTLVLSRLCAADCLDASAFR